MAFTTLPIAGVDLNDTQTVAEQALNGGSVPTFGPLGTETFASDGKRYVWAKAGETIAASTATYMYMLNTNYIFLLPHKERNFVPIGGERQAINQDAIVKLYGWAGNLTASNSFLQGLLTT